MSKIVKRTAVILCGGRGTRLGLLGKKIPKTLIKIQGKPILWYIINILKNNNFNHFILPVGYKGRMIKNYIKKKNLFKKLDIETVNTGLNSNIAKRIEKIKKKIISKHFLLLNGDAIFNFNVLKIFDLHFNNNKNITFIGSQTQLAYGTIGVINDKVKSFERNITFNAVLKKNFRSFKGYLYSGMSIINANLLKLNFRNFKNFEKEFYPLVIKKGKADFKNLSGFWHSIDNLKDIEILDEDKKKKVYIKNLKKLILSKNEK
jgi:glucose-1-phosphate cytidylyltransferase